MQARTAVQTVGAKSQDSSAMLRRACACGQHMAKGEECDDCKKTKSNLRRHAARSGPAGSVPPSVYEVVHSNGQPLDRSIRAFMEPTFGYDFSQVRIHTDHSAAESARAVDALAYTVGRDVVFAAGQYRPETSTGRRLLAHELTHVVQQHRSANHAPQHLQIGPSDDPFEREAQALADSAVAGNRSASHSESGSMVRRQAAGTAAATEKECPAKENKEGSSLCSSYGSQEALSSNENFCKDTSSTGALHQGFTCFRQVHKGSGCPPGKHICFTHGSCCASETHVDSTAPSLKRRKDGFCDISWLGLCSILHGAKDVVPWKKVGIGAGIGAAFGAAFGAITGGGVGAAIGAGVGALAGGVLGGISDG